jgi:hypothetical protein
MSRDFTAKAVPFLQDRVLTQTLKGLGSAGWRFALAGNALSGSFGARICWLIKKHSQALGPLPTVLFSCRRSPLTKAVMRAGRYLYVPIIVVNPVL